MQAPVKAECNHTDGLRVGSEVVIAGLQNREDLNGVSGIITGQVESTGRYQVQTEQGTFALLRKNLIVPTDQLQQPESEEGQRIDSEDELTSSESMSESSESDQASDDDEMDPDEAWRLEQAIALSMGCEPAEIADQQWDEWEDDDDDDESDPRTISMFFGLHRQPAPNMLNENETKELETQECEYDSDREAPVDV